MYLEGWEVDDEELSQDGAPHGEEEGHVGEGREVDDGLVGVSAAHGVEHVEGDEGGEGHGGVAAGDDAVVAHLLHVHVQRAGRDERRVGQHAQAQRAVEDRVVGAARRAAHHSRVHRLHTQTLHKGRRVEKGREGGGRGKGGGRGYGRWVGCTCAGGPSMMMLIQRICMALRGQSRPSTVASATMVSAATLVDSWKVMKFLML